MNGRGAAPGREAAGSTSRDPTAGPFEGADALPAVVARIDRTLALRDTNRMAREAFGPEPWPWWPPMRAAAVRVFESGRAQPFAFEVALGGERRRFAGRVAPELDGTSFATVVALAVEIPAELPDVSAATLAGISHDLRSPLNAIKTWTHVLENHLGDREPGVKRALEGILLGIDDQLRLIEALLDRRTSP